MAVLTEGQRQFLHAHRVARLATADRLGRPHAVPVCFAVHDESAYITVDEKPKTTPAGRLKRVRNISENPAVALVADHYDDRDWSRLGWVMLRGPAEILWSGDEHDQSQARLCRRYPQLAGMSIAGLPVIAIRIEKVTSWGNLDVHDGA